MPLTEGDYMEGCKKHTESVFDNFKISRIYIVDNAIAATIDNLYITATRSEDEFYMKYEDDDLLRIDTDEIHKIQEAKVLHNIHNLFLEGRFDRQPLSDEQLDRLNDWYSFVDSSKSVCSDIETILEEVKSAVSDDRLYDRTAVDKRWKDYAESKGIYLTLDDYKFLLKGLTSCQFQQEMKCLAYWDPDIHHHYNDNDCLGDRLTGRLLKFKLEGAFVTLAGAELSNPRIYIKIEKQICDGYIVFISLHDPVYEDFDLENIASEVIGELNLMCNEGKWFKCTDVYFEGDYNNIEMV